MSPLVITLIVIAVLIGILVALYFVGNRMQKKQMAQKEEMQAAAQQTSMLIIDKKMMKLKDAGLPKVVMEQTPKRFRNAKMPIVKAKVGPETLNLICDDGIFDDIPVKCEVKAMVSGIYITEIRGVRGKKKVTEEPKKKSFGAKMRKKQRDLQNEYAKEEKEKEARKAAKAREKKKQEQAKKITK